MPESHIATILDAIFAHEQSQGDAIACSLLGRDEAVEQQCTFAELARGVRQLSTALREQVPSGERAMLALPFGIDYLQAFLACLHAGIIAVPAYSPRTNRQDDRFTAMMSDCQPIAVLCDKNDRDPIAAQSTDVRIIALQELRGEKSPNVICLAKPDSVAYLQYTSGSTSTPKGVMITNSNLVANNRAIRDAFGNRTDSVGVMWIPMFHDMGLVSGLQCLFVGYRNVIFATNHFIARPGMWFRAISKYGGTVTGGPNFAFQVCVDRIADDELDGLDLSSWKVAYNGAEPIRASTLDRFTERFGRIGFRSTMHFPCYGLAESTLFVSGGPAGFESPRLRLDRRSLESGLVLFSDEGGTGDTTELVSSGRPDPESDVQIVAPETSRVTADDQIGEILIDSPSVAKGYWNDPQATASDFGVTIPDHPGARYMRSGDLGFLHDGELFVTGRHKDLVIVNGRNVFPQDIEAEFEAVVSASVKNGTAVFGLEVDACEQVVVVAETSRGLYRDARHGDVEQLTNDIDTFRQTVWNNMNLHIWEIVFLRPGTFPRTTSGKIRRRACRNHFLAKSLDVIVRVPFKGDPEIVSPKNTREVPT
ncbi:fatty acyl-AMP ligase [Stieleria varia]|uniref:Long-chain-fatty-acid--AMP ligase FadD26 n=1 Tax=Stieleria varia TaxID=2528005 RepID=A0A5C5ZWJ8_9BACT|nr:fatty acyl-AMP ligase [Stieleria varia]TWT91992.1 Long-chain-fatty-acid--AMP ligase FadD26 [Stieleria varia]